MRGVSASSDPITLLPPPSGRRGSGPAYGGSGFAHAEPSAAPPGCEAHGSDQVPPRHLRHLGREVRADCAWLATAEASEPDRAQLSPDAPPPDPARRPFPNHWGSVSDLETLPGGRPRNPQVPEPWLQPANAGGTSPGTGGDARGPPIPHGLLMSTAPGQAARKGPGTGHVALTETRPPEEGGAHGLVWGLYLVLLAREGVLCPGGGAVLGGAAPRLCLGHQEGTLRPMCHLCSSP